MQDLANGHLDVKALGEAANGDENTIVTTRTGNTYPSVKKAIKTVFENGGLPATPFSSKLEMEGSALLNGDYAVVTNDGFRSNNGYYKKVAAAWVYQGINFEQYLAPLEDANSVTKYETIKDPIGYTTAVGHLSPDMLIVSGTDGYVFSSPFIVRAGEVLEYNGSGALISGVLELDPSTLVPIKATHIVGVDAKELTSTYMTQVSTVDKVYRVSGKSDTLSTRIVKPVVYTDLTKRLSSFLSPSVQIALEMQSGFYAAFNTVSEDKAGWEVVDVLANTGDVMTCNSTYDGTAWVQDPFDDTATTGRPRNFWAQQLIDGKYICEYAGIIRFVKKVGQPVFKNGVTASALTTTPGIYYQVPQIVIREGYAYSKKPMRVLKGDAITFKNATAGVVNVLFADIKDYTYTVRSSNIYNNALHVAGDVTWVAPDDGWVLMSAKKDRVILFRSQLNQTPATESLDSYVTSKIANYGRQEISNITLPEREFVFATAMNYILKTEIIDGVDYIKISQDLGKTWTQIPNILGDIVAYHFFSDGTIMLCSPQKVYWTDDYVTLNEATVYDHDGSVFVPTSRHFFAMQTGDKLDFVGNTEIHSWGDYHVDGTPARIWYTTDNGRTIKCSARFGVTDMGGVVRSIRHIHRVYYHQKTDYWYVTTGDAGDECMIIRGRYNPTTDVWAWEVLNSGIYYKFGNIMIDDDNMAFMITDYTEASQAEEKGIYRVHASNLGDFSKYRMIYKAEPSEWGAIAPVSLLLDPNGNKIILPDYLGAGYIWLASEGLDFKRVTVSPNILLTYTIGENYNGDIYCVAYEGGNNLRLNSGSYNLTKALRDAGMGNFMRGSTLITGLKTVLS